MMTGRADAHDPASGRRLTAPRATGRVGPMNASTTKGWNAGWGRGIALGVMVLLPLIGRGADARPASVPPPRAGLAKLDAAQVQSLEEKLNADPEDISARTQLLDHYSRLQFSSPEARQARQRHVLWLIEHHPEVELGGPMNGLNDRLDGEAFTTGRNLWLKQVQAHPENLLILDHAANYLLLSDRDAAEELWTKAEALDPANPRWPQRLAHLYSLATMGRTANPGAARDALAAMERARDRAKDDEFNYLESLATMAFAADELEKARGHAKALLEQAPAHQGKWNYGNAIHTGNLVLGRLAVREDKIDAAKEYLLAAGRTPGSPQLNSFGPSMTLARDLAEKGEKETVVAYFQACRVFWKMGGAQLDAWTEAVTAGNVPDFGANGRR
jgi:tetratricopeptide (TPR) repeat protein